jgi:hypothetical protein
MSIQLSEAPQSSIALLQSVLTKSAVGGKYVLPTLSGKRTDAITVAQPHPVYNLGVRDIVDSRGLASAMFTGWRYLLLEGDTAVAAAEIAPDEGGGGLHFAGINAGPYVFSSAAALRALPTELETDSQVFTVRILRCPALFLWAVWFYEGLNDNHQFWPLDPVPDYLEPHRLFSWSELAEKLISQARSRLADDFNRGNIPSAGV